MKTYTVAERLDLLAQSFFNSRLAELSRASGIDKSAISRIRSGELSLTPYYIDKFMSVCPGIVRSWLESGEGYPGDVSALIVREKYEHLLAEKEDTIRILVAQVEQSQKVIDVLLKKAK